MADYIVNPDALGGGFSDFRLVTFNYGQDEASNIYTKLKTASSGGKHVLLHIHDTNLNKDYGIHSVQTIGTESFEFEDVRYMFNSHKMIIHRWIISSDDIQHSTHTYLLKTLEA